MKETVGWALTPLHCWPRWCSTEGDRQVEVAVDYVVCFLCPSRQMMIVAHSQNVQYLWWWFWACSGKSIHCSRADSARRTHRTHRRQLLNCRLNTWSTRDETWPRPRPPPPSLVPTWQTDSGDSVHQNDGSSPCDRRARHSSQNTNRSVGQSKCCTCGR